MIDQKLTLPCGAIIKNRIAKSAMSENMADAGHRPGHKFVNLYNRWSKGGTGLIITGNVMMSSKALGEPHNVVIEEGHECLEGLKEWARAGTQNGAHLWMQINHPGKQSPKFLSPEPMAPSAIGYDSYMKNMFNPPRALTAQEITKIIKGYAYTAKVAKEAGFTGVQIHGAHGYLVSQFLSPRHNQRTDQWGGSLENRMRFVVEIYKTMRKELGEDFPIGIKLNSADFQKGGFSEEESMIVVQTLGELGMDLIEISGGTYEATAMMDGTKKKDSTKKREAYFLDYCEKVRKLIDTPLLLTGGFRSREGMDEALKSGACEMIGLARSIAIDPDFPNKLLEGQDVKSQVKPLTSGSKAMDKMIPLEIVWYTEQIHRMGKGKEPNPNASVKMSVLRTMMSLGSAMLKRTRA
ncbi:MAG: NADH oxidase [Halobacteriovorax sp.]|nr:NADH oxidase [Halobacteriovorax sp.]|tara:strand:+ start:28163 stop:29386 length:1224 start_codon:yes stop_codon:yes gene_type:complete